MPTPLTSKLSLNEMVNLYNSGASYRDVALASGITTQAARERLKGYIVPRPPGISSPRHAAQRRDRNERIVALYKSGIPVKELSKRFSLAKWRVNHVIRDVTGEMPPDARTIPLDMPSLVARHAAGETWERIAHSCGVSVPTIYVRFRQYREQTKSV